MIGWGSEVMLILQIIIITVKNTEYLILFEVNQSYQEQVVKNSIFFSKKKLFPLNKSQQTIIFQKLETEINGSAL